MRKKKNSELLQIYLSAKQIGKEPYFDADQIDDLLDSFEESYDFTYYDEVLALGLKLHPYNSNLLLKQCRKYLQENKIEKAFETINRITDTNSEELALLKLECYGLKNDFDSFFAYADSLINSQCSFIESVFEYLAEFLNDMNMWDKSGKYIDMGLEMFPNNSVLHEELISLLEANNELDNILKLQQQYVDENPYSYDQWYKLARIYAISEEYEKAIEAVDFALACDNTKKRPLILKAFCLFRNESFEKAAEVFEEYASYGSLDLDDLKMIVQAYLAISNYTKAFEWIKRMYNHQWEEVEQSLHLLLLLCIPKIDFTEEDIDFLFEISLRFEDSLPYLSFILVSFLDNEHFRNFRNMAKRIPQLIDSDLFEINEEVRELLRTGQHLHNKENYKKALYYFKNARRLHPQEEISLLFMGISYFTLEKFKKSQLCFLEVSSCQLKRSMSEMSIIDMLSMYNSIIDAENEYASEFSITAEEEERQSADSIKELINSFLSNKDNNN